MLSEEMSYHIRYLESRLSKLKKNPELNSYQIPIYEKIIQFAKQGGSYEEYLERLGEFADFFPVARSEHLDRYKSIIELYESVGLKEFSESANNKYTIAKSCQTYSDLATKLPIGIKLENTASERLNSACLFLNYLVELQIKPEKKDKLHFAALVREEWEKIKNSDPDFGFESFFQKPYVYINVFPKDKLFQLKRIFEEIIGSTC